MIKRYKCNTNNCKYVNKANQDMNLFLLLPSASFRWCHSGSSASINPFCLIYFAKYLNKIRITNRWLN